MALLPSSATMSPSRGRPRMPRSVRASARPSVYRQTTDPGRERQRGLAQAGAHAQADRRRGGGEHRLVPAGANHDRRGMAGARIGERAAARIVHRQHHRWRSPRPGARRSPGRPPAARRAARARLEVGAQRVAHEGGAGERGAAVAGHVAEDERGAPAGKGHGVVEVPARAWARRTGGRPPRCAPRPRWPAPAAAERSAGAPPPGADRCAGAIAGVRGQRSARSRLRARG